jgi:hypothetical protein
MHSFFAAFWRSLAYCVHPRVIGLSFIPVVLMVTLTGALSFFLWDAALDQVRMALESSELTSSAWTWLDSVGLGQFKAVLAPLLVIFIATPLLVILSLLMVSLFITPAIVNLLARRRFAALERHSTVTFIGSLGWALGSTVMAFLAMLVSVPLWLLPPLVLVLPPLLWGWLTYRVMAFDALAAHATQEERRTLLKRHRFALVVMGIVAGYLGAAPSLIWSLGIMTIVWAPFLIPVSIWMYTLVFTFTSLWFVHFCLAALQTLRGERRSTLEATA